MKAINRTLRLLVLAGLLVGGRAIFAAELSVAAAADLEFALDELVAEFQTNQPAVIVKVTYGSSGNFYAQLQNKAPFDLFLSADVAYPRKLAEAGLALDTNVFLYAVGRLVLWVPNHSQVDLEKLGMQALLAASVKKIAVANPEHAPYGRAAVAAMKSLGVFDQAEPKLVYGENIAQTAQFAQSGAADIGIIALSLAVAPPMREAGRFWTVPLASYPRMAQGGIILKDTKAAAASRVFRDFILGSHGRQVLKRYGFSLPEA
jgi:molybdate transport system substrate-binding protein